MPRSICNLLDTSEQLIRNGWVQNREAVDANGHTVDPWSDLAVAYCVLGSVRAVAYYETQDEPRLTKFIMSVIDMASSGIMKFGRIEKRNDQTSQQEAIEMIVRARLYVEKNLGQNYVPKWMLTPANQEVKS